MGMYPKDRRNATAKQHVEFCPTNGQLFAPPPCSGTPFAALDSRFSAATLFSRLLPAKWGRGLAVVGENKLEALRRRWTLWMGRNQSCFYNSVSLGHASKASLALLFSSILIFLASSVALSRDRKRACACLTLT